MTSYDYLTYQMFAIIMDVIQHCHVHSQLMTQLS